MEHRRSWEPCDMWWIFRWPWAPRRTAHENRNRIFSQHSHLTSSVSKTSSTVGIASRSVILQLLQHVDKSVVGITIAQLTQNKDRMDYNIASKVCNLKVTTQLNRPEEQATRGYLEMMQDLEIAYISKATAPRERIAAAWRACFFARLWKNFSALKSTAKTRIKTPCARPSKTTSSHPVSPAALRWTGTGWSYFRTNAVIWNDLTFSSQPNSVVSSVKEFFVPIARWPSFDQLSSTWISWKFKIVLESFKSSRMRRLQSRILRNTTRIRKSTSKS